MKNKTLDTKGFWKRIKKDFNLTYFISLLAWTIACLLFSKPINLAFGKLGGFLFSGDENSLHIYLWVIIGSCVLYLFGRIAFIGSFLWGQFPIAKCMAPIAVWYFISVHEWVNPTVSFVALPFSKNLNFLSLTYFFCIVDLLFMVIYYLIKVEPRSNNKSSFITDEAYKPKYEEQKDLLGFDSFAERIATEAKYISSSESVVFGINGEWGEGKTSMINLIRQKLGNDGYTVVDFHPWKTNSGKAVTQLFFDVLKDGLKGKIVGINWKIDRYAEALLHLDKTGFGKMLWQLVASSDSVEEQKEKLRKSMEMLTQNLIVIVDDLDRLAKSEIADVLKLMRDTANFPNLVFIAAYDRYYLNEAIKEEINNYKAEDYLDKIVLWEVPIYKPQPRRYVDKLVEELKRGFSDYTEEIEKLFKEKYKRRIISSSTKLKSSGIMTQTFYEIFELIFVDLRTVKRFYNAFSFDFLYLKYKVEFEDFFLLSLIKFLSPEYFSFFKESFYELNASSGDNGRLIESKPEKYLIEIKKRSENDYYIPQEILKYIINESKTKHRVNNSIAYFNNWLIYFHLGNYQNITKADFSSLIKSKDFNGYKLSIERICAKDEGVLVSELGFSDALSTLNNLLEDEPANKAVEKMKLNLWFSAKANNYEFFRLVHNWLKEYSTALGIEELEIKKEIMKFINDEKLQDTLADLYILFSQEIIRNKQCNYLDKVEVFSYLNMAFKNCIYNSKGINIELIRFFYSSNQTIDSNGILIRNNQIIKLMRKQAENYPDDFIKYLILKDSKNPSTDKEIYLHIFNKFLLLCFKDLNDLKLFLHSKNFNKEKERASIYLNYIGSMGFYGSELTDTKQFDPKIEDNEKFFSDSFTLESLIYGEIGIKNKLNPPPPKVIIPIT